MDNVQTVINRQKAFFTSRKTKEPEYRIRALKKLKDTIQCREEGIFAALQQDLGKSPMESYATEIALVLEELTTQIKHLKHWASPRRVKTPLTHFISHSYILPEPYGVILIIAPWNYPFQLLMTPLAGALAAGNCVALKSSRFAPATQEVMESIIGECFPEEYVSFFRGGNDINQSLLQERFDYIFFTGGTETGRHVMEAAAHFLTPVSLELGGKSPVIVDKDADLELAARRIIWGKCINAGQTCVAPDYLLVHRQVKDALLDKMKFVLSRYFGEDPRKSPDFPRIASMAKVDRLAQLMGRGNIVIGGQINREERYVAPTVIDDVSPDDPVMKEEIFGPVLPVLSFDDLDEAIAFINEKPRPLALYYFSNSRAKSRYVLKNTSSGGACINDTVMHVANPNLPFGGVGMSGMGRYHGKATFDTFSNFKGVIRKTNHPDIPLRYPPYHGKLKWIRMMLR